MSSPLTYKAKQVRQEIAEDSTEVECEKAHDRSEVSHRDWKVIVGDMNIWNKKSREIQSIRIDDNLPAKTAGNRVSVTKYVKKTLKHWGKHCLKISP